MTTTTYSTPEVEKILSLPPDARLNVKQTALVLGICDNLVKALCENGELNAINMGTDVRASWQIPRKEVLAYRKLLRKLEQDPRTLKDDDFISTSQVAELCGVTPQTVNAAGRHGLAEKRIGKTWLFRKKDAFEWFESTKIRAQAKGQKLAAKRTYDSESALPLSSGEPKTSGLQICTIVRQAGHHIPREDFAALGVVSSSEL